MNQRKNYVFSPPNVFDKLRSRAVYWNNYANNKLIPTLQDKQIDALKAIQENGFVVFENYLSGDQLERVQNEFHQALEEMKFSMPCLAQTRIDPERHSALIKNHMLGSISDLEKQGVTFNASEATSYNQVIRDFKPSTLTLPMLQYSGSYRRIWTDPFLLGIVARYLGMVPKLVEAYVRRNFPVPYKSMNHFWHRDLNNRFHLLKMFVFLSDCTLETGPHEYIKGSHRNFQEFNNQRYFEDAEVDSLYPEGDSRRALSVVKAGTVVIEDTRGVHRANLPTTGFRDLGFAVFMPLRPFYPHQNYKFPEDAYQSLSDFQKAFIPDSCVAAQ